MARWGTSLSGLRSTPYLRRYLVGYTADTFGDFLWYVTLGWVSASLDSPVQAGAVLSAGVAPAVALMTVGGAIVERVGAVRVLRLTLSIRALAMLAWTLTVSLGEPNFVGAVGVAVLIGATDGLHRPAMETYPTELATANSQTALAATERLSLRGSQIAGGLIAGWLLSDLGSGSPAAIACAAFVVAFVLLASIPLPPPSREANDTIASVTRASWRAVLRDPVLSVTVPVQSLANGLTAALTLTAYPLLAQHHSWGAHTFGLVYAANGAGLISGTLVLVGALERVRHRALVAIGLDLIAALLIIALAIAHTIWVFVPIAFAVGLVSGPAGPLLSGLLRERAVIIGSRGGVQGVQAWAINGSEPLGYLLAGVLAAALGVQAGAAVLGVILLTVAVWGLSHRVIREDLVEVPASIGVHSA